MGFTKFTKNVLNVSALPDRVQNQASSLKLVFDQAGVDIKAALNALISELEAKVAAANIGADVASVTEKTVQGILTAFENEIANRYTKAETNNAILADTNELIADVKIDLATGLLTVTKKNGTKQTFETSTEAESYAVGGTGTRPGEDTDNAKYYAQIAKQVAGGDFVTVVEMEGYAQKKGLYPNYNETELKGEVIETETTLEAESVLKVHGNSVQETRSGKNLFNINTTIVNKVNELNYAVTGEQVKVTTTTNNANYARAVMVIPNSQNLLGKTITLSSEIYTSSSNVPSLRLYQCDSTGETRVGNSLAELSLNVNTKTVTLPATFSEGATQFSLEFFANVAGTSVAGDYATYTNTQLEIGSVATSYEPYGAMPSPEFESPIMSVSGDVEARVEGKNLLEDTKKVNVNADGITFAYNADGTYTVNGSNAGNYNSALYINNSLTLPAGKYHIIPIGVPAYSLTLYDGKKYIDLKGDVTSFELTEETTFKQIYFQIPKRTSNVKDFIFYPMLAREPITKEDYEPYKLTTISMPLGDIELRSTPDGTRDTFTRVDGVWNKKENITPFTIAENMVLSVNIDRYNVPYANVPKTYISSGVAYAKNTALLASYDEIISTAEVGHGKFATNFSAEHVAIFNSGIADLATAKTILAGETGIIKCAEPTYTPITDPALISALDELEQLVLHKGYNRITVTGVNGVKAQLELEIAPTALLTNISETEAGLNMPVPVVSETGDVLVKVPKVENQMTINPATGVVNVKGLTINGVSLDAYIRSIIG